jgi:hypothetical protein
MRFAVRKWFRLSSNTMVKSAISEPVELVKLLGGI